MNLTRLMLAIILASAAAVAAPRAYGQEDEQAKAAKATTHAEAGAEGEHGNEADRNPMAFDPDLAIFSAFIFLLLVAVLGKFAWPSIAAALDERERKIADNIAAAAAKLEDAKRVFAEHEAKLTAAAGEVRAMLDEARRDADTTRKRIEEEGRKAVKDEQARAEREIQRARDAAVKDLAVASANTAIELARNVIKVNLTPEQNDKLIREAVAKLEPSKN